MRYVGSKNRISKELAPIIQSYITVNTKGYIEPFVGGANMIDKIVCDNKIGSDLHTQLIALLNKAKESPESFPEFISEKEYNLVKSNKSKHEDWYLGIVGFCSSFGAKYFGGYARDGKDDNSGKWSKGAILNLKKQSKNIQDVRFQCCSFLDYKPENYVGYVFYCDIPYRNTTKYATKDFPYDEFYDWCRNMSKNNIVLVSEYNMPDDFECIWSKEVSVLLDSRKSSENDNVRTEKLFLVKYSIM